MLFNSYIFWAFYAVVFGLYRLLRHRAQNYLLLIASYVFYSYWDWRFVFAMLFSTVVDYSAARIIGTSDSPRIRKRVLIASLSIQLSLLCTFKYYNFFAHEFSGLLTNIGLPTSLPLLNILLPVGISFYTFQTMSYVIDVYRGQFKYEKNFVNYALYLSFFPHLVAGPIVRAAKLLPQLTTPRQSRPDDFRVGLYLVLFGLFKKVFIGDNLAVVVNTIFQTSASNLTGLECLLGIYAFAFQIYCDFSGYSSIAQGIAKWLNIDLSVNFNHPYLSESPSDFWGRWHITLSTWFRDYVFVPVARRKGRVTHARLYGAQIFVMLLSGLWHGAAWTFVVWGLYHGILLCGHRLLTQTRHKLFKANEAETDSKIASVRRIISVVATFHFVCIGWLIFRADSLGQAWSMFLRLFSTFRFTPIAESILAMLVFYAAPLMVYELWLERRHDALQLTKTNWILRGLAYSYCALMLLFFPPPVSNVFIYFQF